MVDFDRTSSRSTNDIQEVNESGTPKFQTEDEILASFGYKQVRLHFLLNIIYNLS
jgi:hypothetical protein